MCIILMLKSASLGFYSVAVMTRALAEQESGGEVMVILQQISSYMLLACGALYIITVSSLQVDQAVRLIQ